MSLVRDAVELDAPLITPANAKESNTKEYCLTETPFHPDFDPLEGEARRAPCPATSREEDPCQAKRS